MFEFFGNIYYLLLLALILIITYITVHNAWSREILSKQSEALVWNNSLIILNIILITVVFVRFSWVAGISTLIPAFIINTLMGRKITKRIKKYLLDFSKSEDKN